MINQVKQVLKHKKYIQLKNYNMLFSDDRFKNFHKLNKIYSSIKDIEIMQDLINKDEKAYKDVLKMLRKL